MQGLHLTADLHRCRCDRAWLLDAALLGPACMDAVRAAGLRPVGHLFHAFEATARGAGGVTATVLLAESHLCVHTWPEQCAVTLDVYVCNFGADHAASAHALMNALLALFQPGATERHTLQRGAMRQGAGGAQAAAATAMATAAVSSTATSTAAASVTSTAI